MDGDVASGIERAVLGVRTRGEADAWLARHLHARLGLDSFSVIFRSGRVAAVYGVVGSDGRHLAVKAHRRPVDRRYLAAAVAAQLRLADAGYPCPRPLDGPACTGGLTAVIETLLEDGERGNGHEQATRAAMVASLHAQMELLRGSPIDALITGAPAWTHYEHGPWPTPHDPIFDFASTPPALTWLDDLARRAAQAMSRAGAPDAIAHADWTCGNLRFRDGQVSAAYDWDSLAAGPEPILVGLSAGAFTAGSTAGDSAPTPTDVRSFLQDYDGLRERPFTDQERTAAAAAATWVMAYNARCLATFVDPGADPAPGSPLDAIAEHRQAYLDLRW